jgi:hemerythrin-like domain-containing protein
MMPVGPLMIEHRLIERMVKQLQEELNCIERMKTVDPVFVDTAVDFFRFYADRCHHGKEEDILFAALASKPLADEHRETMDRLVEEHVFARRTVGQLLLDKDRFLSGKQDALSDIRKGIQALLDLYPKHIEREDKHFFLPVMDYLSIEEQEEMLHRFAEFDRKLIRERYRTVLEELEERRERKS